MLENNEGAIKNGQCSETCNIGYTKKKEYTTQYVLDSTTCIRKQIQITFIRHELSYN